MTGYYDRTSGRAADGTPTFSTPDDLANEGKVDRLVSQAWDCTVHKLPPLFPIDRYIEKDGRLAAYLEIKSRQHPADRHPTIWLNHRKYLALILAHLVQVNVKPLFVVQFEDEVRWIDVSQLPPSDMQMGGTRRRVKSSTDREPMVWIPVASMKLLYRNPNREETS